MLIVVLAGNDSVLMSASTSLSINAQAAVTFAVSVTSANASIQSSLSQSVDTSLPSTVPLAAMFTVDSVFVVVSKVRSASHSIVPSPVRTHN